MLERGTVGLIAAWLVICGGIQPAGAERPRTDASRPTFPSPAQTRSAAERGLKFLVADAVKWRKEKTCASCHQGAMTVWALAEAKSRGFSPQGLTLGEAMGWTRDRLAGIDKPRDSRPGWNMVNSIALYLALMARAVPDQNALTPEDLKKIAGHLARHQENDGKWAWSLAPSQNRPPPFFESDEIATRISCMALASQPSAASEESAAVEASRTKGIAWLAAAEQTDTTQAIAFRLLESAWRVPKAKPDRGLLAALLKRQNADGGWSQIAGIPSDAYATGQSLYILSLAGVRSERREMQHGLAFLCATQKEDGSWPMTPRAQPGATPMKSLVPITYFGSTWATLALMRAASK